MKKAWIAIGILTAFILADILIRELWFSEEEVQPIGDTDTVQESAKADKKAKKGTQKADKKQATKSSGIIMKPPTKKAAAVTTNKACLEAVEAITLKKPEAIVKEDFDVFRRVKNIREKRDILAYSHDYMTCTAVDTIDWTVCDNANKWFEKDYKFISCFEMMKMLFTLKAYYVLKFDEGQFKAKTIDFPAKEREWMLEFFQALGDKNPEHCPRLSDSKLTHFVCNVATGKIKKVPSEKHLLNVYYFFMATKTGKKLYIDKIDGTVADAYFKSFMGREEACVFFKNKLIEHCSNKDLQIPKVK